MPQPAPHPVASAMREQSDFGRRAALWNPYAADPSSAWKSNAARHQIDQRLRDAPAGERSSPGKPGRRTMLDLMLEIFGFAALFGQAALFLIGDQFPFG